jgi:hypothetical protein
MAPLQMMLFWMWLPSAMLMLSISTQLITFTLLPSLQQQQQQHVLHQWHRLPDPNLAHAQAMHNCSVGCKQQCM